MVMACLGVRALNLHMFYSYDRTLQCLSPFQARIDLHVDLVWSERSLDGPHEPALAPLFSAFQVAQRYDDHATINVEQSSVLP